VYPALPPNRTPGQLRQTVGIVGREEWQKLRNDERDAANALSLHVWWRCRQEKHPALEGEDCVFLSDKWVKRLLTEVRARKRGESRGRGDQNDAGARLDRGHRDDEEAAPLRAEPSSGRAFRGGASPEGGKARSRAPRGPTGGECSGSRCSQRSSRRRNRCRARMHVFRPFRNAKRLCRHC
jgi:hypothetical protein